jgi:Tfp pilus assembly protein PilN
MIKINLLGAAPPPSMVPSQGGPPASKARQAMVLGGALVIAFGIVGVIYTVWTNQIDELQKKRTRENIRRQELAVVKSQNDKYQERLRELETRINTIQALQNSRVGPVELMSALGSIVDRTSDVYLYTMAPAGDRLQLKGQSSSVDSMANFLAFLKNSGSFQDVQLEQFYQDDIHDRVNYKFALSCQFKSPSGGVSPTAGGEPVVPSGPGVAGAPGTSPTAPPLGPGARPSVPPQSGLAKRSI